MNTYYKVIGSIDGEVETLFGSFVRSECVYEMDAERDGWKVDGYKKIKIITEKTAESPDPEVYVDNIRTADDIFMRFAPDFNFEKSKLEIIAVALERGIITKIDGLDDAYLIAKEWGD